MPLRWFRFGKQQETDAADTPAASTRLGTDVVPVFQSVHLVADARKPDYTGTVRIDLDVKRAVPGFALHAEQMDIRRMALTGPGWPAPAGFADL